MNMSGCSISVKGLEKSFGTKHVLCGVDFDVELGESLVIIGGSGTGKSVTLKCILGLLDADAGEIFVDSNQLVGADEQVWQMARKKIGMLFQGSALFDSLTVWENIFFCELQSKVLSRSDVGLSGDVADLYPAELSGGMQRRVGLARAIAPKPKILLFDEPTAGLDPIISGVINDLIRKCVKDLGASAITITHDMRSARTIGDKIAMLYDGKILWHGPVKDIDNPDNPYVEQFIHGSSQGPIQV
jgi:phospholipid/cholesterol/gamma-HCH transport system ATP-binding protein